MVVRRVPVGSSLSAMKRLRRSSRESRAWLLRDSGAATSLRTRFRAYLSLSVGMPWQERLRLAGIARDAYWARKRAEKAQAAAQERLQRELDQTR